MTNNIGLPEDICAHLGDEYDRYMGAIIPPLVLDVNEERAMRFVKKLPIFQEGPSWGGFESIVNTPGIYANPTVREFECIPEGLIRISVGLESQESLLDALDQGLKAL